MKSFILFLGSAALITACSTNRTVDIAADDARILYMGRTVVEDSTHNVLFSYPGVTAILDFKGSSLEMSARPGSGQFMVEIDSIEPFKVDFNDSTATILLADSLPDTIHHARIAYAIEGQEKLPYISGFKVEGKGAELLQAPERPALKMEFIGNSMTCGYGIEAESKEERWSFETENNTLTYAHLTARALDADFNIVARSGIGMYRSYGGDAEGTPGNNMPYFYDRTLYYTDKYEWDHNAFHPDVICINLGTNDTWREDYDVDRFVESYNGFVDHLRELHPDAKIVLTVGCMIRDKKLADIKEAHDRVAEGRENVYRFDYTPCTGEFGYGADWHPSRGQQAFMAEELTEYLRSIL